MIYSRYNLELCKTEEDKQQVQQLQRDIKLANYLDIEIDCFRALGVAENAEVFCRYKDAILTVESNQQEALEVLVLKNVWVPKTARSQGLFTELIRALKAFCQDKDFGLMCVSNPTEVDGYDNLLFGWQNFRYVNDEKQRDRLADFLLREGFKEGNPAALVGDFYAYLVRIERDYGGLVPRWFAFNLPGFASDDIVSEAAIKSRLGAIRKALDANPDQFGDQGQRLTSVYR